MNGIETDIFDINDKIDNETPELIPNQGIPHNTGQNSFNYLFQNNKMFQQYQNGFQVNMNEMMTGSYDAYPYFDGQNIQMLDPSTGNFQFIYNHSMPFHHPDLQYVVNKGDFPYMNTPYFGTDVHGNFYTLLNEGGQFSGKGGMNGIMGENGMSGFFFNGMKGNGVQIVGDNSGNNNGVKNEIMMQDEVINPSFNVNSPQTPTNFGNNGMEQNNIGMKGNQTTNKFPLHIYKPLKKEKNQVEDFNPNDTIDSIFKMNKQIQQNVSSLMAEQKTAIQLSKPEKLGEIKLKVQTFYREVQKQIQSIENIFQNYLLELQALHQYYFIKNEFDILLKQLAILVDEIEYIMNPSGSTKKLAALVIYREPFPEVINKGQQLGSEVLIVKLLTGASFEVRSASTVKAELVNNTNSKKNIQPLKNTEQNLDLTTREAAFPIKFSQGTRRLPVNIKFSIQVQLVMLNGTVIQLTPESPLSSPFIIITNENQWEGSEEYLLKKDAFQGNSEIPWIQFCNTFQKHFFKATRQDSDKQYRILKPFDLNYIHEKFFSSRRVADQNGFDMFWKWFGKTLQVMRYQRYMSKIWQNGLIYGFMNKPIVHSSLDSCLPGTFLIRFSESHGGRFAIGYVNLHGESVKHYLVSQNDVSGKKTISDFLSECDQFMHVLQLVSYNDDGYPLFRAMPKTELFKPYLSQSLANQVEDHDGYDPLESPLNLLIQAIQDRSKPRGTGNKRKATD